MKKCICWDLLSNTVLYLHIGILQPGIVIRKQMKITSFTTMFTNMKIHISHCRSVLWIHTINSLSLLFFPWNKFKNTNHSFLFKRFYLYSIFNRLKLMKPMKWTNDMTTHWRWVWSLPGDAALEFEVEVVSLLQQTPWQKMVNDVFPLVCLALVPTLLGLVGLYLYKKANAEKPSKKKAKDKKSKKK